MRPFIQQQRFASPYFVPKKPARVPVPTSFDAGEIAPEVTPPPPEIIAEQINMRSYQRDAYKVLNDMLLGGGAWRGYPSVQCPEPQRPSDHFYSRHSGYLGRVYNPRTFSGLVCEAVEQIRKLREELRFDAIAFRGSSGCALGYPVGAALEIPLIYVRKPEERSHGRPQEGFEGAVRTYIIVDDFISSGNTVRAIMETLQPAKCVGIVTYEYGSPERIFDIPVLSL